MNKTIYRLKLSAGFMLLQVSIALAVMMIMTQIGLYAKVREVKETNVEGQADALVVLNNAVATYMTNNYQALVNNTPLTDYPNIYAPTVAQLNNTGLLDNFSATNYFGGTYGIQITRVPTGCAPANCDLSSLTYLTTAIINPLTGRVDGPLLGAAATRAGGNAGFSSLTTPGTIEGLNGAWTATNPVTSGGNPVAGILAMRAGYGATGMAQFLRLDGTKTMTGNLNVGGQNILGANAVNSTTLNNTGAATIGGLATMTGISNTGNISNTGTLTNTGNATVGGTMSITGQTTTGAIVANGSVSSSGDVTGSRLMLNTVVTANGSCAGLNGYQARTTAGSIVSCVSGVWTEPTGSAPPAASCNATTVSFGSGCQGSLPSRSSGQSASVTMTYGSGNATYACNNGTWSFSSGTCTPPAANCGSTTVTFGAGCQGNLPGATSGSNASVTMTYGSGNATYSCSNGSWSYVSGSCTMPANCSATSVTFGGGCQGNLPATSNGSNASVSMTYGSGNATYSCSNGSWSYVSGSCAVPASCPARAENWGGGCAGNLPLTSSGQSITIPSINYPGSASYSCNNGSWTQTAQTCSPPASCASQTVTFGAGCQGTLPARSSGQSAPVTMTYGSGSATYVCSNGTFVFQSGSCTPPPAGCNTTVTWAGTDGACSAPSGAMSSGSSVFLTSTNGNTGSVTATCTNGSISTSGATCTKPRYKYSYPTTRQGQYISFSPERVAIICQNKGKSPAPIAESSYANFAGSPIVYCGNINAQLDCTPTTGSGRCTDAPWVTQGCYVVSMAVCM